MLEASEPVQDCSTHPRKEGCQNRGPPPPHRPAFTFLSLVLSAKQRDVRKSQDGCVVAISFLPDKGKQPEAYPV